MIYLDQPPSDFSPSMEVSAVHCICSDKILLLKRAPHKTVEPGRWGVPAGRVHKGETKLDAAIRELYEETGITAEKDTLLYLKSIPVRYPGFDFTFHLFRYDMSVFPGQEEIRLDREHTDYAWAGLADLTGRDLMRDEYACIQLVIASYT